MDIKLCDDNDQVYEVDGVRVPRVTGVIGEMLHTDFEKQMFASMDVASLRGTIVHEFVGVNDDIFFKENAPDHCGLHAFEYAKDRAQWQYSEDADAIATDVGGRVAGWSRFVQDEDFETLATEFRVGVYGQYAGTIDRRGRTKTWGRVTLDIKPDVTPFASLQLAAYVNAGTQMDTPECADMNNDRRLVVALNPKFKRGYKAVALDKYECFNSTAYRSDVGVFLGALAVMNWKLKHGRLKK